MKPAGQADDRPAPGRHDHARRLGEEGRRRRPGDRRPRSASKQRTGACAAASLDGIYLGAGYVGRLLRAARSCVLMIGAEHPARDARAHRRGQRRRRRGSAPPRAFFAMAHAFKHGDFVPRDAAAREGLGAARSAALRDRRARDRRGRGRPTSPGGRTGSPTTAASSTTSRRACCRCRCGSRSSSFAIGSILLLDRRCSTSSSIVLRGDRPELRRRGRGAPRARRLLRPKSRPQALTTHGHPRRRRHPARS